MIDPTLHAVLRLGLGLLFGFSAWHKLRAPAAFREAMAGYSLVPRSALSAASAAIVAGEAATAIALLLPGSGAAPACAAATLLALYSAAIGISLLRGRRDIDCGCAGPGARRPVGEGLLVRNGLLLAVALTAALPVTSRTLLWIDVSTIATGLVASVLLYAAGDTLLALQAVRRAPVRAEGNRPWSMH